LDEFRLNYIWGGISQATHPADYPVIAEIATLYLGTIQAQQTDRIPLVSTAQPYQIEIKQHDLHAQVPRT
jgi:homospermidine synthase